MADDTPINTPPDAQVIFTPSGRHGRFPRGTSILDAARTLGVDLDSICGGHGLCGRCQVAQSTGSFAKFGVESLADNLSKPGQTEASYRTRRGLADDRRLGCATTIDGDIVIDVPADSQVHKQVVRKRAEARDYRIDPAVRLYYIEVEEPDLANPSGDLERLLDALQDQWKITGLHCDLTVLQKLQTTLRTGKWQVTAAIHDCEIIQIWPGFHDQVVGVAYDIGSTTIAGHLANLLTGEILASAGMMNPQIRFGEDLMSRVSYAMMNSGGAVEMTAVIQEAVNDLATELANDAGISPEEVLSATIVGNPIMHHLLIGIDPVELGGAPFALASNAALTLRASEIGFSACPHARVYILPCIAGHVGADTAGVILSEQPHTTDDIVLLVDIGTNAEIVLGNKSRLLAASSPTGPAFEGAQIICGQRAAPGAIERVRIDPRTKAPRFKVIGSDLWSDDEGFRDSIKGIGVTGICGSGIVEALAEMFLAGVLNADGLIDGALASGGGLVQAQDRTFRYILHPPDENQGEAGVSVYQTDVRAIQLAKGALYAGARLLMDRLGVDAVDRVVLAGAFGTHIDPKHALVLGLIPDCPLDKVTAAGNAAGTGALIALLDLAARQEIETVVHRIEKVETAVEPEFQRHFVDAMAIPHKSAPYPHLAAAVAMPAPKAASENQTAGRRNRRRAARP